MSLNPFETCDKPWSVNWQRNRPLRQNQCSFGDMMVWSVCCQAIIMYDPKRISQLHLIKKQDRWMIERQTKSQIPYQCGPFSRIIQSFVSQIQITCKEALPSCMPKMIIFYLWICSLSSAKPFGCRKSWQVGLSF